MGRYVAIGDARLTIAALQHEHSHMGVFPDGTFHALPQSVGKPGMLAAILGALPAHFVATDELVFTTPFGDAFAPLLRQSATPHEGDHGRLWVLPVGAPALASLVDTLARPERGGAVYAHVYRGETALLECEDSYDWLWLSATLPPDAHVYLLADIQRRWDALRAAAV
jgi:hypothetical protein